MSAANGGTGQPSGGPRPPGPVSATPTAASVAVNSASGSTTSAAGGSLKRVKSGLSCAECRRSKLKCDRSFPCQSCIRRGCAAICPDGTLTATKGNKVLMAHAERLTQQVKAMSARIKELEQALAMAQGSSAHPLLLDADPRDGHTIVSELEGAFAAEMEEVSDAIGSLSIGTDGKTKYFGETASSEYLQNLIQESSDPAHMSNPKFLGLPPDIIELVKAYPFGMRDSAGTTEVFKQFIPPRDRTETVAALFYTNASWLYDPVPRDEFNNLIRDPIYRAVDGYLPFKSIPAHNFSIFFMILASGLIFSPSQSAPILMEQYHALARAAFSLDSITRGASTASVQAMIMTIYYSYWTDRNGTEVRWLYNGLCVRIAQMIGLQRDSAGWNLDKDEVQRRRTAFWEFYTWDAWSSVITGRPPVLNIAQADCRFPDDTETVVNARGQVDSGWHRWKYMYNVNCLTPSVQRTFSVRPLQYSTLLELDKRIRNFPLPPEHFRPGTEDGRGWSSDPRRAMTQHCSTVLRESNLMYLHRSYFAQAIRESTDPLQHKYGQSVITAYQSTRALISSLRGVFAAHPTLVGKIWWFWSGIFSSCVILGAVVVECPGCKLAESALADLDAAIAFFELGSAPSRAARTMSMLQNFYQRAHEAYNEYRRQIQAGNGPVTTPPKDRHGLDNPDELEVLGGRKTLVNQAGAARSPSSSSSSRSSPEVNQGPYAQQRLSPPTVSVTSSGYYQPHPQQQLLAPIVTEGLQVPSGHAQSYDYGWDTSPVSAPGVFVYSPQGAMQVDQPHQQQHRHPFADYHGGYGQPPSQQQLPPGQNVYSTSQLSGPSAHMQDTQGTAGMGFQEDIWQDFVQHLGMRTE